jgi:ankyrin repeat protein
LYHVILKYWEPPCKIHPHPSSKINANLFIKKKSDTRTESGQRKKFVKFKKNTLFLILGAVAKDARNERGWTALMFAARNGQLLVIKTLVEKGYDLFWLLLSIQHRNTSNCISLLGQKRKS